jgi:hypothetical protein
MESTTIVSRTLVSLGSHHCKQQKLITNTESHARPQSLYKERLMVYGLYRRKYMLSCNESTP